MHGATGRGRRELTPGDEQVLRRLVGPATFVRGSVYARSGAVRGREWETDTRLRGAVQGGAREAYRTTVEVTRAGDALSGFDGSCSCPVGVDCKHAVALLLARDDDDDDTAGDGSAGDGDSRAAGAGRPRQRTTAAGKGLTLVRGGRQTGSVSEGWELPLRPLLSGSEDPEAPTLGIQFELVPYRPRPGSRTGTTGPGIRLRPVVPGSGDNWVRTGISWANLDYLAYWRSKGAPVAARVLLLKELLALSLLSGPQRTYGSTQDVVWLESLDTRRLWDLLWQARDLRIPLLRSGRGTLPVDLRTSSAAFTIDVTRSADGLDLAPHVDVDRSHVPLDSSLLIGNPAHGIAWWDGPPTSGTPDLHLAPFAGPLDETLRGLLGATPVGIPRHGEGRFLRDFLPVLRRRVAVSSSDGSVALPEPAPDTIVLSVTHRDGHRIVVEWARATDGRLVALPTATPADRDDRTGRIVARCVDAVRSVAGLVQLTPFGERLAPTAELRGMTAARFATEVLPVLEGVEGLVLEQHGPAPDYREAVEEPVVVLRGEGSGGGDWFDLTVDVTVGGEEVPFADLFVALAEDQSHLILPSGTYFSLDSPELRQLADLIAEARALQDSQGDGSIRLSRFQASLWDDLQRLGIVTAQAGEWESSVRALAGAGDRIDHAAPAGLHATLRPYQLAGFNWLAFLFEHRLGGVLADDMGLGKTLQALALVCHVKDRGLSDLPFLVVAPTSVVGNWATECARFAPGLRVVTVTETAARRRIPLADVAADADVVITSYALYRLEYDAYAGVGWAGLFLDEAQFAKNHNSQTYQRAKMLPVACKVAMTGTPLENNLMELWSLLSISAPGLFGRADRFTEYYRVPIEKGSDQERLAQLRRRIRPLMLRRTKEQVVADLPDKQEQVLEMDLNPRHRKLYQTYLQRERQKVLGLIGDLQRNRFEIFRSLTLLRQASLAAALVDPSQSDVPSTKLDALVEMLDGIVADGHRVLVFSQFTRFLTMARERIQARGIESCYLDGRTRDRAGVISGFRTGTAPVFLISLKAGGFGLNLTEADYCVLLDPWWNPATEAQAVDRIHRIGQTRKVMVYRFVARDTLEEKVMALKARKAALFANVLDAGGFESGALTAEDIRGLLD